MKWQFKKIPQQFACISCLRLPNMFTMVITWQELRDAREYADMTQGELAKMLGVSVRTIVNWEAEDAVVPRKREYKVERLLGKAMRNVRVLRDLKDNATDDEPPRYFVPATDGTRYEMTPEEYDEYLSSQKSSLGFNGVVDVRSNMHQRRRAALSPYTDVDLIDELRDRAKEREVDPSDWSATGPVADLAEYAERRDVARVTDTELPWVADEAEGGREGIQKEQEGEAD